MANNDAILQYKQLKRYDAWIKKYITASRAITEANDITDQSIDLDSLILTEKAGKKADYMCTNEGGSAKITNRPKYINASGETEERYTAFRLSVNNIRWESDVKFMTIQTFTDQWGNIFTRYIDRNGSEGQNWSEWTSVGTASDGMTDDDFLLAMTKIDAGLNTIIDSMPEVADDTENAG